jgi:la-related protein 1
MVQKPWAIEILLSYAQTKPSPLRAMVIKQIEYYFRFENLINYLRSCMDARGWVPISIVAKFNRVRSMTTNVHFVLDALRSSNVVEVQGDKLKRGLVELAFTFRT